MWLRDVRMFPFASGMNANAAFCYRKDKKVRIKPTKKYIVIPRSDAVHSVRCGETVGCFIATQAGTT